MKKIISVFLLVTFILSILVAFDIKEIYADIEIRNIEVLPNSVDSFSQYNIYIVLHKDLNRGDILYIKFPSECTIPQSINKELVEIGGNKPSSVVVSSNTIVLTLSEPVLQNQGAGIGGILVTFSSSAGIKNPSSPDIYSIEAWSTTEPNHSIYSFYIGTQSQGSTVSGVNVILSDNNAGKSAQYEIIFSVSMDGALIPEDYVDV